MLASTASLFVTGAHLKLASAALTGTAALAAGARGRWKASTLLLGQGLIAPYASMRLALVNYDITLGRAWAYVYDVNDSTVLGVLPVIQPAWTLREINKIGSFELMIPETHDSIDYTRYTNGAAGLLVEEGITTTVL